MATYNIRIERKFSLTANGQRSQTVTVVNRTVKGFISDAAKVCLKNQTEFYNYHDIKNPTDDIRTMFVSRDSVDRVIEVGACFTRVSVMCAPKTCIFFDMWQVIERID